MSIDPSPVYDLELEPQYRPDPAQPREMVGRVLFLDSVSRRLAGQVEVRAVWTADGEIEIAPPDPDGLPGLTGEEMSDRAHALVALLRDDRLSGRADAGGDASEP